MPEATKTAAPEKVTWESEMLYDVCHRDIPTDLKKKRDDRQGAVYYSGLRKRAEQGDTKTEVKVNVDRSKPHFVEVTVSGK